MRARQGNPLSAAARAAAACTLALVAGAQAEVGSAPDTATWVTDGPVHAIARSGDRTFIGGDFSHVGPRTGSGAQVTRSGTGSLSPPIGSFPEISGGAVFAAVADNRGGWYIGGDFTHVGGAALARLVHLVPNGSGGLAVDSGFAPAPDGPIRALALGEVADNDADVLYVGGDFDSLGGDLAYRKFAAVDASTGVPRATMAAPNAEVRAIDVLRVTLRPGMPDQEEVSFVFVAGPFSAPKNNVMAVWGVGTSQQGTVAANYTHATTALPGVRALTVGPVKTTATQAGAAIYVAGEFGLETTGFLVDTTAGTVPSQKNINVDARPNDAACAGCLKSIDALATSNDGGILYLGGSFTRIGAADRRNLMAVTGVPDVHPSAGPGFVPKAWNPAPNGAVGSLLTSGTTLYAGGGFTSFTQGTRVGLAALSPSVETAGTGDLLGWNPRASGGAVDALAVSSNSVYVGGSLTSIGASPHENVAALDAAGRPIAGWNASTNGRVNALAAGNGRVYLGGRFSQANGQSRTRLAAVDALSGTLDGQFGPAAQPACTGAGCVGSEVFALSLRDNALYVGGAFAQLGGKPRANAGAVDAGSGGAMGWAPNPDDSVYSVLATCGTVYAGGSFDRAGGKERRRLAALDPQSGAATAWNPSVESGSAVRTIARDLNVVYVGGNFAKVGGAPREDLAAIEAASGDATEWNPSVPRAGEEIWAIAAPPGSSVVYAGGRFTRAGRADRSNVAAFGRGAGDATGWSVSTDAPVRALAADGGLLAVGGDFRQFGALRQHGFASFGFGSGTATGALRCEAPPPPVEPAPPAPRAPARSERAADTSPPSLAHVRLSHRRFITVRRARRLARGSARIRAHVGTTFKYGLSERAVVRYTFKRKTRVRCRSARWRRACERWPRGDANIHCRSHRWQRRCYRWRRVGSMRHFSEGGKVRRQFDGRLGRRWLRPGRYRVRLRAADVAGNRSSPVRRRFRVVRR